MRCCCLCKQACVPLQCFIRYLAICKCAQAYGGETNLLQVQKSTAILINSTVAYKGGIVFKCRLVFSFVKAAIAIESFYGI